MGVLKVVCTKVSVAFPEHNSLQIELNPMYILILPCHSCTYFNQNKCVQSEIERRGLLVQVSFI